MKYLLLIVLTLVLVNCTTVNGAEWVRFTTSKGLEDNYYYDNTSIFFDSEGAARIWIKQVFSDKGRQHFMESMKQNGYSGNINLDNISYVLDYFAIKCIEREYKLISYYVRDVKENVIDSGKPEPAWNSIPKKSSIEMLHNIVCKRK